MSRNDEAFFSQLPAIEISRSRFDRSSQHKTTMNAGELVPIYMDEVLPGDSFTMDTAALVRMTTPIFPVMDNAFIDLYYFFVPNRLVWDHWKEFNGENSESYWTPSVEYTIPQISLPRDGFDRGSVADYFGIPTNVGGEETVSALPFRSYALIWNEWFRDQNLQQPCYIPKGDETVEGVTRGNSSSYVTSGAYGGKPLPVAKPFDYFTSALPAPQKGPAVELPLFDGVVPVSTLQNGFYNYRNLPEVPLKMIGTNNADHYGNLAIIDGHNAQSLDGYPVKSGYLNVGDSGVNTVTTSQGLAPANLGVDIGNVAVATINQLRQAFQVQKLYERDARGGTRYREILKSHFGVTSPDATMQVPEYLGGKRIPINVDQVLQTSSTDDTSPQGNTAAYSLTTDVSNSFTKSFTEHGFIIGVACIRTQHTYQQGLERMWSRKRRFDYYWPALANIGEQAILKKEILLTDNLDFNNEAFGYNEAWADYRYKPSRVSGAFRSNVSGSLDAWHYADYYDDSFDALSSFGLQDEWIRETSANIDRTLAVPSTLEDQFLCDFAFKCVATRPMPLYSIPGLIDHN